MTEDTPKTVTVRSLQWHTYHGQDYPEGAIYEIEASLLDSIIAQRKAVRVEAEPETPPPTPR